MERKDTSVWKKMVHASFLKVVAFDLLFFGLGIGVGAGIGTYIIMNMIQ